MQAGDKNKPICEYLRNTFKFKIGPLETTRLFTAGYYLRRLKIPGIKVWGTKANSGNGDTGCIVQFVIAFLKRQTCTLSFENDGSIISITSNGTQVSFVLKTDIGTVNGTYMRFPFTYEIAEDAVLDFCKDL